MTDSVKDHPRPDSPSVASPHRPPYWRRLVDDQGGWRGERAPGADLAALRQGIGRVAGTVPAMWPFYTTLRSDGKVSADLRAEHLALTLYGVHQQSETRPMHRAGVGVGKALAALRHSGAFSPEAVDRRFAAAATATSLNEAAVHLRGLVTQLRGIHQPLDYDRLLRDLRDWQYPDRRPQVRRRWGSEYFTTPAPEDTTPGETPMPTDA